MTLESHGTSIIDLLFPSRFEKRYMRYTGGHILACTSNSRLLKQNLIRVMALDQLGLLTQLVLYGPLYRDIRLFRQMYELVSQYVPPQKICTTSIASVPVMRAMSRQSYRRSMRARVCS